MSMPWYIGLECVAAVFGLWAIGHIDGPKIGAFIHEAFEALMWPGREEE